MPCDTRLKKGQTISQRKEEVAKAATALSKALEERRVKVTVGPQGAVAFVGWKDEERDGITDNCAYRRIMQSGSALARAEITRAAQLSGRQINTQAIGQGVHSHDGGKTWHNGH